MKNIFISIAPVPAPRMTRSDRWKKRPCVVRYFDFKDQLSRFSKENNWTPPIPLSVRFTIAMPKSWSKKKKKEMCGKPHLPRPDLDNLIKAFKDSLFKEDSHVWKYGEMEKVWGEQGSMEVKCE